MFFRCSCGFTICRGDDSSGVDVQSVIGSAYFIIRSVTIWLMSPFFLLHRRSFFSASVLIVNVILTVFAVMDALLGCGS